MSFVRNEEGARPDGGGEGEKERVYARRDERRRWPAWRGDEAGMEGGRKVLPAATVEWQEEGRRRRGRRSRREMTGKSNEDASSYPRRCGTMSSSNLHQGWTPIHRRRQRRRPRDTIHVHTVQPALRALRQSSRNSSGEFLDRASREKNDRY